MAIAELGTTMLALSENKRQSPAAGMSISMAVAGCVNLAIDKHSRLRCIETYSGERLSTSGASVRHPRLRYPRPGLLQAPYVPGAWYASSACVTVATNHA